MGEAEEGWDIANAPCQEMLPAPKTWGFCSLEGRGAAFPLGCPRIWPPETGSWPNIVEGLWHGDSD